MPLNTIEDILKVEELLTLREEYKNDTSVKGEIIQEGVKSKLEVMLSLQTTELGRIESNTPDFSEIQLRELDATEEIKKKFPLDKEKKIIKIPAADFLRELKISFKSKLEKEIEKKQGELSRITKLI